MILDPHVLLEKHFLDIPNTNQSTLTVLIDSKVSTHRYTAITESAKNTSFKRIDIKIVE